MSSSVCWECNKFIQDVPEVKAGVCSCGAIQPLPTGQNYFQVLGLEPRYDLDLEDLEQKFRAASRQFHPDRFARSEVQTKRISLQRITAVNDAYRTLKHPVKRAEYLLGLGGIHVGAEDGSGPKLSPMFLMQVMEQREELEAARKAADHARVRALGAAIARDRDAILAEVAQGLSQQRLPEVAEALTRVRYYDRFLDEVAVHEDEQDQS